MYPKHRYFVLFVLVATFCLLTACSQTSFSYFLGNAPEPGFGMKPSVNPLTYSNHAPERLSLPTIGVDTLVEEVRRQVSRTWSGQPYQHWEVANYAAGWHNDSGLPGKQGNIVLSGHNNVSGAVFRHLDQLQKGDEVTLWAGQQIFTYIVDEVMILPERDVSFEERQKNAQWIRDFGDRRLTLVSCWPEDDNTHRVVVVAHLNE